MNNYEEDVDRLLSYLEGHGIVFTFEQFEFVMKTCAKCQGSRFMPEAMAGLLVIMRYALRQKTTSTSAISLAHHVNVINATLNVTPDLFAGIGKLYEIFQASRHNQDLTNVPLAIEFKYQLEHLSEFFTKAMTSPDKEDNS